MPSGQTPLLAVSDKEEFKVVEIKAPPLYQPLIEAEPVFKEEDDEQVRRIWRATEATVHVPPNVIGQMTHKAIELWLTVDDPRLISLLESLALAAGLATQEQRVEAIRRVRGLIERFCDHPLRAEIQSADERHHEAPYSRMNGAYAETGYIDLLYRTGDVWHVVDFKTDSIRSSSEREELIALYTRQISRYANAVHTLLGQVPQLRICFLDDEGRVGVIAI
jgi:ATP-dependent exoDNAse (exonuclease V) beta subunit